MRNLKDVLRKPIVICGIIGALGLGIGVLTLKNIGLNNQNDYLFSKHVETGNLYANLVAKYSLAIKDSMKISNQHSLELLSLKGDKLELAIKFDSLQKSYTASAENLIKNYLKLDYEGDSLIKSLKKDSINFAKESLDISEESRNLFEIAVMFKEENDFFKKYNRYLDSLLLKCESNKMLQDKN